MTKEERTDIRVGITVLIGIVLLLGWHRVGETLAFRSRPRNCTAHGFPTAAGLERGDPVDVNGVKLGTVEDIQLRTY